MLQWQKWVVVTETVWCVKLKIRTVCPFSEKLAKPCVRYYSHFTDKKLQEVHGLLNHGMPFFGYKGKCLSRGPLQWWQVQKPPVPFMGLYECSANEHEWFSSLPFLPPSPFVKLRSPLPALLLISQNTHQLLVSLTLKPLEEAPCSQKWLLEELGQ